EPLPDHSTLSRVLDRFGDPIFDDLFMRSISQCRAAGLIDGRVLHLDATTIRADLDRERVGTPDSPDPDARYGKFPGKRLAPGYKQQTVVDAASRVVVEVAVTPADRNEHEGAIEAVDRAMDRLGQTPEAVCADAAYASGHNKAALEERGVRLVSPPPKAPAHMGGGGFTSADFTYDETRDEFTCPAGAILQYMSPVKGRPRQRQYRAPRAACRACPLKTQCTIAPQRLLKVSADHAALLRLRADSRTESFRELYRARSHVIEGIFGEAKLWHRLGRAWRRGLLNMLIQSLLVAAVLNFKRLMAVVRPIQHLLRTLMGLLSAHRSKTGEVWTMQTPIAQSVVVAGCNS
ncbi:MAG: transposase, partial [candidate division Zixibacteria bacterium]|nr:transposase [candidate division Zixibacteria bacterium]